uniref:Disintegrin and metalloproteinase domain-containing protein 12 n=1 Tax=Phallusia mammillata TaxID=59560 RepID=A0A6F9D6C6_9ASCI|nr:disintegrin and metalloproteinase domain-containing protein 12 [Phallusia mammillata]
MKLSICICISFLLSITFAYEEIEIDAHSSLSVDNYQPGYHLFKPLQFHDGKYTRRKSGLSTLFDNTTGLHHHDTFFVFEVNGSRYELDMSINEELLPRTFSTTTFDDDDVLQMHRPSTKERNHCYYQGSVKGIKNSLVVMSTCYGLSGAIFMDGKTIVFEPVRKGSNSSYFNNDIHTAYHLNDKNELGGSCGTHDAHDFVTMLNKAWMSSNKTMHSRSKRAVSSEKKFVELMVVADNAVTKKYDRLDLDHRIKEIANILDSYYRLLGVRVALSNIEAWTKTDKIPFKTNAQEVLNEFLSYRQKKIKSDPPDSPWVFVDNVQLLYGNNFDGATIGMATVGTMCGTRSGGVNEDKSATVKVAATIAHEMGHNFGMNHDTPDCSCPRDVDCLMAPSSGFSSSKAWSSCSETYLQQSLKLGLGNCLLNVPEPDRLYGGPKCGNDIVETGEECDCGLPEDCTSQCCNSTTCKLMSHAECDSGICCESCKYTRAGTVCRDTNGNECDLPEFCTGHSQNCPGNVYMENGMGCQSNTAMCFEGICLTLDLQCENVWGPGAVNGADICYQLVNKRGTKNGNCGKDDNGKFVKCSEENAKCGKLQCTGGNTHPIVNRNYNAYKNTITIDGVKTVCKTTHSDANASDVSDPGLVKDGSTCGNGMVCSDGTCSAMPILTCSDSCNGNGVCNNLLHCHCDAGFAPPDCINEGTGGSIDSGPIRDGIGDVQMVLMLVMFLVVLPIILGVGGFLWYCYCGGRAYIQTMRKNRKRRKALTRQRSSDYRAVEVAPPLEEEKRLEAVRRNKQQGGERKEIPFVAADSRTESTQDSNYKGSWRSQKYENIVTNGWDDEKDTSPPVHFVPTISQPVRPPPPGPANKTQPPVRPSGPPPRPAGTPARPAGTPARAPPPAPVAAVKPFSHVPPVIPPPQLHPVKPIHPVQQAPAYQPPVKPAPPVQQAPSYQPPVKPVPPVQQTSSFQPPVKPAPPAAAKPQIPKAVNKPVTQSAPFKPSPLVANHPPQPPAFKPAPPSSVAKPTPPNLPPIKPQPPAVQNRPAPARGAPAPPNGKPTMPLKPFLPPSVAKKPYHGSNPVLSTFAPADQGQRPQSIGNFTDVTLDDPVSPDDSANLSVMEKARLFAQSQ